MTGVGKGLGAARERVLPGLGTRITVGACGGRLAARPGTVVAVHAFEAVSQGRVISVQWEDDGSVSWLVPDADIEVVPN
jgi:hypothetical protein